MDDSEYKRSAVAAFKAVYCTPSRDGSSRRRPSGRGRRTSVAKLIHRNTVAESYMLWQCIPGRSSRGDVMLIASLAEIGGMSVMMPIPSEGMSRFDWTILIDRIERMFWFMHGQTLADPARPAREDGGE
jgi:hypothetical protein